MSYASSLERAGEQVVLSKSTVRELSETLRAWLRKRELWSETRSSYLFLSERGPMTRQAVNSLVKEIGRRAKLRFQVHPPMLRHSTGYSLANRGYDTRLIQD